MSRIVRVLTPVCATWNGAKLSFLDYCKSKRLSPNTITYYDCRLLALERYLATESIDETPLTLTVQTIRAFLTNQADISSPTTAQHSYCALRAFYGYLQQDGFVDDNPLLKIDKPKRRQKIIETFSEDQLSKVIATCDCKTFTGSRDRAMLLFMLDSGVRVSELCNLDIADISWPDRTGMVVGKGDVERTVCFGLTTGQALQQYVARRGKLDHDRLFVSVTGEPLDRYRVREIVIDRCGKAEVTGVRCSPHTMRHTAAVSFLRNGASAFDVQKLLGHSTLDMTKRYVSLLDSDLRNAHARSSPVDNMAGVKTKSGRTYLK